MSSSRAAALQGILRRCPRCGKASLVEDEESGELICSNCGFVLKDKIEEEGPEWRNSSRDEGGEDKSRTGLPTSIASHDMGVATIIGRAERAFRELDRLADKLTVPEAVKERAAYIYRKALERGLIRGRSISSLIAASLYAAFRDTDTPRSLKDVAAVTLLRKKDLARDYRMLLRELDVRMPVSDPARNVARIASAVGLSEKTRRRAIEILRKAEEEELSAGKDPVGLAASALYIASTLEGDGKTQKEIAKAAGVTEVTIRNRYKGLIQALGLLPEQEVKTPAQQ
ncbi:MAG: transcription initiation factor IIB [Thaumarchaeota archaeon]|nr:MAG: transcription initiation factor IIB [Nitrososphaerota archaeon]